ncbi:hypothetical protein MPDQ_002022 [Monascus purpureus]|uniref:Arabinan endo-1,5-alpha-L-arabinosidase n=1 Tax=Monascus purpureus TaxID=5098 RepID=A0A507R0N4_MONPU|nr:hypothetical protein MPDQ_002022 [Monascus purpureus]
MLTFIVILFITFANAYSPGPCSGDCQALDPALIQRQSDGKYFRFSTGGGVSITTAGKLEGPWTQQGEALPNGSSIHISGVDSDNLWAPDVHYENGIYYMYYAISADSKSTSAIGVASSPSMEAGSWEDHGGIGVGSNSDSRYNAIDANWISIQGQAYLNFGSYFDGLQQVEMLDALNRSAESTPHQIAYNTTDGCKEEASFMVERDGFYYLLFSSGINEYPNNAKVPRGEEYRIVICRSTTGTGDFVDASGHPCTQSGGTTLLASDGRVYGPGGQGVYKHPQLGYILYYHYADENIGLSRSDFQFGWNYLCWTQDNWPIVCDSPGQN